MYKYLVLLILAATPAMAEMGKLAPVFGDEGLQLLKQNYAIDKLRTPNAERILLDVDELGNRFRVKIHSVNGRVIPGILAMPESAVNKVPLALALHPMGRDKEFWYQDSPVKSHLLVQHLRQQGWAVLSLDARWHGELREKDLAIKDIVMRARSGNGSLYRHMIRESVREYRYALNWASTQDDLRADQIIALGYSMGAQMSLLLAAHDSRIASVLSMVPPYVHQDYSSAAPRHHMALVDQAEVLLLAAKQDPYASVVQTQQVFSQIASENKTLHWYDSGHVLPEKNVQQGRVFLSTQVSRLKAFAEVN